MFLRGAGLRRAQQFQPLRGSLRAKGMSGWSMGLHGIRRVTSSRKAFVGWGRRQQQGHGAMWRWPGARPGPALAARQAWRSLLGSSLSWRRGGCSQPGLRVWLFAAPVPSSTRTNGQATGNTLGLIPAGERQETSAPTLAHSRCHHVTTTDSQRDLPLSACTMIHVDRQRLLKGHRVA